jgi:hypothetical protein
MKFDFDENRYFHITRDYLECWKAYSCKNIQPDLTEGHFLFVIDDIPQGDALQLKDAINSNLEAITWIKNNAQTIQKQVLKVISGYLKELIAALGYSDEQAQTYMNIDSFMTNGKLNDCLSLSYIRLPTQQDEPSPKYAFEFECSWDVEHGCGIFMNGLDVVRVGTAEAAYPYE